MPEKDITDFADETPFHGIRWMITKHTSTRILWITLTGMCLIGCGWFFVIAVRQYVTQYPDTTYTIVNTGSLQLPAIEVCPPGRFSKSKAGALGLSDEAAKQLHLAFFSAFRPEFVTQTLKDQYGTRTPEDLVESGTLKSGDENIHTVLEASGITFAELLNITTFSCEDLMEYCEVSGVVYGRRQCCSDHQSTTVTTYGKCMVFSPVTQTKPGPGHGLVLHFHQNVADVVPGLRNAHNGVTVRTVPDGKFPDSSVIFAPKERRSDISVNLVKGRYLSTKSYPCENADESSMSRHHCVYECLMQNAVSEALCRPWDVSIEALEPVCLPTQVVEFLDVVATGENAVEQEKKCNTQCKFYCQGNTYDLQATSIGLPNAWPDDVVVDIHYSEMAFTEITQFQGIVASDMAANLGGHLGLWLGGSIIAVAHTFIFWFLRKCKPGDANVDETGGTVSLVKQFLSETQFHGLVWVGTGTKFIRFVWTFIVVGSLIGCIWQWALSVQVYVQQIPSTTYTVVDKERIRVPKLQMCQTGRLYLPFVVDYGISAETSKAMHASFLSSLVADLHPKTPFDQVFISPTNDSYIDNHNWTETTSTIRQILSTRNQDYQSLMDELMLPWDTWGEVFAEHGIMRRQYRKETESWFDRDLVKALVTPYGSCLETVATAQGFAGPGFAHFFRLRYNNTRYADGLTVPYAGYLVKLLPNSAPESMPVFAERGGRTLVTVQLTNGTFLSTPDNPCEERISDGSTETECDGFVLAKRRINETCSCRPVDDRNGIILKRLNLSISHEKPACLPQQLLNCVKSAGITAQVLKMEEERCESKRGNRFCDVEQYRLQSTFIPFTAAAQNSDGEPMMHPDDVMIDVHYKTLRQIEISQFPRVTSSFLAANIGGLLGLWLGGSVMAAAHVVFFWLWQLCPHKKNAIILDRAASGVTATGQTVQRKRWEMERTKPITARRFATETPFHGFSWMDSSTINVRNFWGVLFLACLVCCGIQWTDEILKFKDQLPATAYAVKEVEGLDLPAIEVCGSARFSKSKTAAAGLSNGAAEMMHMSFMSAFMKFTASAALHDMYGSNLGFLIRAGEFDKNDKKFITSAMTTQNISYEELIDSIGFDCEQFVEECYRNGQHFNGKQCCENGQREVVSLGGRCLRFDKISQRREGPGSGFFLRMGIPTEDVAFGKYHPYWGVEVRAVPDGNLPELTPTYAPAGGRTNIQVSYLHGHFKNSQKNRCRDKLDDETPRQLCLYQCFTETFVGESCPCRPYDVPNFGSANKSVCTPVDLMGCFSKISSLDYQEITRAETECGKKCKHFCEVHEYNFASTFVPFDGEVRNGNGTAVFRPDELVLDVYYKSISLVQIQQFTSITKDELTANLGGLLGLWLGGSILAVVHAVCFWIVHRKGKGVEETKN